MPETNAWDLALAALERAMDATGAIFLPGNRSIACIQISEWQFYISTNFIIRYDRQHSREYTCLEYCYKSAIERPPDWEILASFLLLLNNDPTIFERWKRQNGPYA